MEGIIREVNVAYESVKKGKEEGFDSSIFAEEHIHSVIDLVSNKSVTDALSKMQSSFKDSISDNQCKDDLFSIVKGSDIKQSDLFVNGELVDELVTSIKKAMEKRDSFSFLLQYGVSGNHQKETVKIAAAQLNIPVMIIHREDLITRFSKDCEPHVKAMFKKCRDFKSPIILYIENVDGVINSIHASPNELMKRKIVEKELCNQLALCTANSKVIVILNSESPFSLKNELQSLQGDRFFYASPNEDQRRACIEELLSHYDNELSDYCLQRLLTHSSCCSIQQIRTLFDQLYFCMLFCKYNQIPVDEVDLESTPKAQQYPVVAAFCEDKLSNNTISVPNINDALLNHYLDKMKPAFSVVDTSRVLDWCHSLSVPPAVIAALDKMIVLLRERDETLRKQDLNNTASREPVERRSGEKFVMPAVKPVTSTPAERPSSPSGHALSSSKFCRMMTAETLDTSGSGDSFRQQLEERKKEEAERLKQNEQRNLAERERMRREEEERQRNEEERRKAEFEAMKRKEEERQRRIEEKLAAQEAERNRKIEEQRRKNEEAARKRREEAERREAERHQREQEELERREEERQALAEKRRQREAEERRKKELQNQREAEEMNRRYQEERRRIYEASMDFSAAAYKASTARLDERKTAEQLALERDQKKREEAIKKAREQAMEKLNQEKAQRKMESQVYERLAALRRPAPASKEEKLQRVEEAKQVVIAGRERLAMLKKLQEEVKGMVLEKRKREEEERKKREEEERKKREEEERKRKEEEEKRERERQEEEARKKKQREEEAARRKAELEKEKEQIRLKKQAEARKMEERLLESELKLLDAREKLHSIRKLLREVKRLWNVCYKK